MGGAYLLPQNGGAIYFDVVEDETVERDASVTDHPVEQGANVTDHYRVKPNTIKLEAFVSQEPIDPAVHPNGQGSFQGAQLSLPAYPDIAFGSNLAAILVNPIGSAIRQLRGPPSSVNVNSLQWAVAFDSLTDLLNSLEALRSNATLVDVATKSWYYGSYLLGAVTTKRNAATGTGTKVSITLKQVRIVSTSKVAAPVVTNPSDAPAVSKGNQYGVSSATAGETAPVLKHSGAVLIGQFFGAS